MEVVVVLIVGHRAGRDGCAWLRVVDVANQEEPAVRLIILRTVGGQRVSLTDAVSNEATAENGGSVTAGILSDGGSPPLVLEIQVTIARNILGARTRDNDEEKKKT